MENNENTLDATYRVSEGDGPPPPNPWFTHPGKWSYLEVMKRAEELMRERQKPIITIWDNSWQAITVNETGVLHYTNPNDPHYQEHLAIQRALGKVWQELHAPTL